MRLDRRMILRAGAALTAAPVSLARATEGGFDRETFEAFVEARIGRGDPVYWDSIGTAKAAPSGDLLCVMEGYD